nr:3-phytase [Candidatus Anoxychlamydiales bacterium]
MRIFKNSIYIFILLFFAACTKDVKKPAPKIITTDVYGDADECAFWIDQKDPQNSVLIGNDKSNIGALYVWDLEGNLIYKTDTLNRPVGVDVRYGMKIYNREVDIVVCALRSSNELKVFEIDPKTRKLIDITTKDKILTK